MIKALLLLVPTLLAAQQPLPPWTPGTLDIHSINTGRGDSTLFIFPDGTSLMIDAGDGGSSGPPRGTPAIPNAAKKPGEWIARYARHMLRHDASPALDHFLVTHFHDDHMGGVADVGQHIPIRRLYDRGWPSYDFPTPVAGPAVNGYRAFIKKQTDSGELAVERLVSGRNDQIILRRDRARYPNFEIRNVSVNGEVWTGVGANTATVHPPISSLKPADYPRENPLSCAIRISYGAFDYFNGGDMPGGEVGGESWRDMETPVAKAIGPTDVIKLNHHGNQDSNNEFWVRNVRPRVFLIPVWSADHPGQTVLTRLYSERLYPGPRDGFATNMLQANKTVIGQLLSRLKSDQGHIVVRVEPGGAKYSVYILDDSAETFAVKAVHGPYESR